MSETRLLRRLAPDIADVLALPDEELPEAFDIDADPARPTALWGPESEALGTAASAAGGGEA